MAHYQQSRLSRSQLRRLPVWLSLLLFHFHATAGEPVPPSPEKPWAPPQLGAYEQNLANGTAAYKTNGTPVPIDPDKIYNLPELIDIAERSHPDTRIAWEQARQDRKSTRLNSS